jgi:amino-acid N-acetyltransferase
VARVGLATKEDLPAVSSLLEEEGLPEDGLWEHLGSILVAREGDEVVGSAALELYGEAALLRSVAVRRGSRGEGLGRRLVSGALELAEGRGVRTVYLLTEGADGYFARLGFRRIPRAEVERDAPEVGRSVQFASVCPQSAQAMALPLPAAPVFP